MNKRMWRGLAMLAAACGLASQAMAAVVFNEPWTGAPAGVIAVPGSLNTSAYSYTTSGSGGTPPTIEITSFSGDLRLNNTAASNTQESHLVATFPAFAIDRAVTIEFDAYDPTNAATSSQRYYVLMQSATGDGYRVRFSSQNVNEEVLNATIFNDGIEVADRKFDDNVEGPGILGTPDTVGGTDGWHVRMSFVKDGTDVKVFYEVTGIGATPNLVAFNSFTFDNATYPGVTDVSDNFEAADIWVRRPLGSLDNVVVTTDETAPIIALTGTSVSIPCGTTYSDDGATATDNVEGDISTRIVTDNPVPDPAVAGVYTVRYNVSDLSGNDAVEVTRTVTVTDTEDPVVTLNGAGTVSISCGENYSDEGATATDNCTDPIVPAASGLVDPFTPGDYTVTYTATDDASNVGTATVTVTVLDDCPPILVTPVTPLSQSVVTGGGPATFEVSATGAGTLTYQWYFDNGSGPVAVPGADGPALFLGTVTAADEGTYSCEVSNGLDTVTSPEFTLTVTGPLPAPGPVGLALCALLTAAAACGVLRRTRA